METQTDNKEWVNTLRIILNQINHSRQQCDLNSKFNSEISSKINKTDEVVRFSINKFNFRF